MHTLKVRGKSWWLSLMLFSADKISVRCITGCISSVAVQNWNSHYEDCRKKQLFFLSTFFTTHMRWNISVDLLFCAAGCNQTGSVKRARRPKFCSSILSAGLHVPLRVIRTMRCQKICPTNTIPCLSAKLTSFLLFSFILHQSEICSMVSMQVFFTDHEIRSLLPFR